MKYVDEYRDRAKAQSLVKEIERLALSIDVARHRPLQIMEVCGGHTHSIFRYGIEGMLPDRIELVHRPGCPVCVLPMGRIDDCIAIAEHRQVIFTTFGDAMRVPGSTKSLLQAKAEGCDIRMVYSPMDALALAREHPEREVVFFGIGFETTMPSTALAVLQAEPQGIGNFSGGSTRTPRSSKSLPAPVRGRPHGWSGGARKRSPPAKSRLLDAAARHRGLRPARRRQCCRAAVGDPGSGGAVEQQ
jgi:hydrogenase expression/formation protein HypD